MGLYRLCNQIKFTFDVCLKGVEFRPASWIVGSLVAKALQIGVNISDRGGVAVQKRLVAGENVRVAGIVRAKNLAPRSSRSVCTSRVCPTIASLVRSL